jgi:hypothetical protein
MAVVAKVRECMGGVYARQGPIDRSTRRAGIIPYLSMALASGTRLGSYEITHVLGAGGMGEDDRS